MSKPRMLNLNWLYGSGAIDFTLDRSLTRFTLASTAICWGAGGADRSSTSIPRSPGVIQRQNEPQWR